MNFFLCMLKKCVVNIRFLFAVISTTLLCFSSIGYNDAHNGKAYSVLELLLCWNSEMVLKDYALSPELIIQQTMSGYLQLFLPIIATFPFVNAFCIECSSQFQRYTIFRTNKKAYITGLYFSSVISSGLVVTFGTMLYYIIISGVLPSINSYEISVQALEQIFPDGINSSLIKVMIKCFVSGFNAAVPSFILCSLCVNPYIIICLPFLLIFIWDSALTKIMDFTYQNGFQNEFNYISALSTSAYQSLIYSTNYGKKEYFILTTEIFIHFTSVIIFSFFANKKIDFGA